MPVKLDGVFQQKLVDYYESNDGEEFKLWIVDNCIDGVNSNKNLYNMLSNFLL